MESWKPPHPEPAEVFHQQISWCYFPHTLSMIQNTLPKNHPAAVSDWYSTFFTLPMTQKEKSDSAATCPRFTLHQSNEKGVRLGGRDHSHPILKWGLGTTDLSGTYTVLKSTSAFWGQTRACVWRAVFPSLWDLTDVPSLGMESQIKLYNRVEEQKQEKTT